MTHWDWMNEHWWVGFWLWFWGMGAVVAVIKVIFKFIAVLSRGWPPAKIVNHYATKEEEDVNEGTIHRNS